MRLRKRGVIIKKMAAILVLFIFFMTGCANGEKDESLKVPFLYYTYSENQETVVANLGEWDLNDSTVTLTDKEIYKSNVKTEISAPILEEYNEGNGEFSVIKETVSENKTQYYGRDIVAEKEFKVNEEGKIVYLQPYLYEIQVTDKAQKEKIIMQYSFEYFSSPATIGEEPSCIDYNSTTQKITFLFFQDKESEVNSLYVATIDLKKNNDVLWKEIELSRDDIQMSKLLTPTPSNSFLVDDLYYVENAMNPIAINIESGTVIKLTYLDETIEKFRTDYLEDVVDNVIESFGGHIPYGSYGDIQIYKERLLTGQDTYVYMAYQNKVFLGAIHILKDGTWNLIDRNYKKMKPVDLGNRNMFWVLMDGINSKTIQYENMEELYRAFGVDYIYFPMHGERSTILNQRYNLEYLLIPK